MTPATQGPSPEMMAALEQLRDIRLPGAVSWWPLAPGWWAALAVLLLAAGCALGLEHRRRRSLKYRALKELDGLQAADAQAMSTQQLATAVCVLVRRTVLAGADGVQLASTHGDAWAQHLAATPHGMPQPIAHYVANAPYQTDGGEEREAPGRQALLAAARTWLRRHA